MKPLSIILLSAVFLGASSWSSGQSAPQLDPNIRNIKTITIKWKRTARIAQAQPPTSEELQRLTQAAGIALAAFKDRGYGRIVFQLPEPMSRREAEEIAARIQALPEIEYAEPERFFSINAVPNDPFFEPSQWNLQSGLGGIDAQGAWDLLGAGDTTTVVAVVDTGVLFGHEDLVGRFVTGTPAG